jgi:hypothetical protein
VVAVQLTTQVAVALIAYAPPGWAAEVTV